MGLGGWEVGRLSLGVYLRNHLHPCRRISSLPFFLSSTFPRSLLLLPGFVILNYSQILSSHELECKRGEIMGHVRWGAWSVVFLWVWVWVWVWVEEGLRE